jgi:hypothetical protein
MAQIGLRVEGGVIDSSYRGEIKMMLSNRNPETAIQIHKGDYIVQMVIHKIYEGEIQEVKELDDTPRGNKGFGSTGVNAAIIKKEVTELEHKQQKTEKHGYKIGKLPTEAQKETLEELLKNNEDVFAVNFEEIRIREPQYYHDIDTGNQAPIKKKPYRVPPAYRKWQQEENKRLEETGITRKSNSPWGSPCVLVPKKGAEQGTHTLRQCHDYIALNLITKKDAFPLPLIDDILDELKPSARWMSVLDMFSGFFQIGMTPRATERSAFVTAEGQWEYLRMPFGLCNAPASFQRMMNEVFSDMIGTNLLVYIDDVTIYSDTFEEHIKALTQVFRRLREKGLFIKPSKCTFATDSIQLLGFTIDNKGIRTDAEKVSAVVKFPRPTDRTTMRAFLGLANYYRRFIKDYAMITRPLNHLLRNDQDFYWTSEQTEAFRTVKLKLCTEPILARPDWNKLFTLYTDASAIGLGAVLSQKDDQGKEHPVIYWSKATNRAQSNYGPTQLECLAVVQAVKKLRHYLVGRYFEVVTDHAALAWLMNTKNHTGRMARWVAYLQEYDMKILYRKGALNQNADGLSRMPRPSGAQGGADQ